MARCGGWPAPAPSPHLHHHHDLPPPHLLTPRTVRPIDRPEVPGAARIQRPHGQVARRAVPQRRLRDATHRWLLPRARGDSRVAPRSRAGSRLGLRERPRCCAARLCTGAGGARGKVRPCPRARRARACGGGRRSSSADASARLLPLPPLSCRRPTSRCSARALRLPARCSTRWRPSRAASETRPQRPRARTPRPRRPCSGTTGGASASSLA